MRPGFRMPCGSSAAFTRRVMRASGSGSGGTTSTAVRSDSGARISIQVPPAAVAAASTAACAASVAGAGDPDQAAAPVEIAPRTDRVRQRPQHGGPGRRTHRNPPDRVGRLGRQRRQVAHRPPHRARRRIVEDLASSVAEVVAQPGGAIGHRCGEILDAHQATERPKPASAGTRRGRLRRQPRGGRDAVRRAKRRRQRRHARRRVQAGQHDRADRFRRRQHLQRDLGDDAQRAVAAGQQLAQVETGDVLQHAPAGVDHLAVPGDRADAQHVIAHRAPGDAPRAGQVGRDHAAQRLRLARAESAARSGGSAMMCWPCSASVASISASGVPARAEMISSFGE